MSGKKLSKSIHPKRQGRRRSGSNASDRASFNSNSSSNSNFNSTSIAQEKLQRKSTTSDLQLTATNLMPTDTTPKNPTTTVISDKSIEQKEQKLALASSPLRTVITPPKAPDRGRDSISSDSSTGSISSSRQPIIKGRNSEALQATFINFKKRSKQLPDEIPSLKQKSCILLVSVGKENFEKQSLIAMLKNISEHFKFCLVVVAGDLQRYNLAVDMQCTPQQAEPKGIEIENDWIKRFINTPLAEDPKKPATRTPEQMLTIPHAIIGWHQLRKFYNSESCRKLRKSVDQVWKANEAKLAPALEKSKDEYSRRWSEEMSDKIEEKQLALLQEKLKNHSGLYLEEEGKMIYSLLYDINAILTLLPEDCQTSLAEKKIESRIRCIIYPGSETDILKTARETIVQGLLQEQATKEHPYSLTDENKNLLEWVHTTFSRIKPSKIQKLQAIHVDEQKSDKPENRNLFFSPTTQNPMALPIAIPSMLPSSASSAPCPCTSAFSAPQAFFSTYTNTVPCPKDISLVSAIMNLSAAYNAVAPFTSGNEKVTLTQTYCYQLNTIISLLATPSPTSAPQSPITPNPTTIGHTHS